MTPRTIVRAASGLAAAAVLSLGAAACTSGQNDPAGSSPSSDAATSDGGGSEASGTSDGGGGTEAAGSTADDGSSNDSPAPSDPSRDATSAPSGSASHHDSSKDHSSRGDSSASASKGAGSGTSTAKATGGGSNDTVSDCTYANLDVSVSQGDAAAGSVLYTISFTNTGEDPCRIGGYPGVSAVGNGDGDQIGEPAGHSGDTGSPAVLIPNGHAEATVKAVNIGDDGGPLGADCKATAADGWRIYPPGSTKAAYVEQPGFDACAGSAHWLTVDGVHGMK